MIELKFLITKRTITVQVISENLVAKELNNVEAI